MIYGTAGALDSQRGDGGWGYGKEESLNCFQGNFKLLGANFLLIAAIAALICSQGAKCGRLQLGSGAMGCPGVQPPLLGKNSVREGPCTPPALSRAAGPASTNHLGCMALSSAPICPAILLPTPGPPQCFLCSCPVPRQQWALHH